MIETVTIEKTALTLVQGDITHQETDAIVNAANSSLLGGGGVDGAIHRAGGPAILEACRAIRAASGGCAVGDAVITTGGNLKASKVIHTVGPVWSGGMRGENAQLERAWTSSLVLARDEGLRTVAFPSISTGSYRFPIDRAALIALMSVARFVKKNPDALDEVRVVLFTVRDLKVYGRALEEMAETMLE